MKFGGLIDSISVFVPLICAATFSVAALQGQHIFDFEEEIGFSFGIIEVPLLVTETELRVAFGALALMSLIWAYLRDYSGFFPQLLRMQSGFDDPGVEKVLKKYQTDARFKFAIYGDWKSKKRNYFRELERKILAETSKRVVIGQGERLAATGSTTFVVEKLSLFTQTYRVSEADGNLTMADASSNQSFATIFHLQNTAHAKIDVGLSEIIFKRTFFVAPLFSQTYRFNPTEEVYYGNLVACTKVRIFPTVGIGETLYLVQDKQKWFPIGYCSYEV